MTNICYNCLDRNIESGNGDKIAIYWEGNEPGIDSSLTYNQLLARVCQVFIFISFYFSSYKTVCKDIIQVSNSLLKPASKLFKRGWSSQG